MDPQEKEKLLRDNFVIHGDRSGNTNNISNSKIDHFVQGAVINGDNNKGNVNTTLKIINGLSAKDRKELSDYFDTITNQNKETKEEVTSLKKMIDQHNKTIAEQKKTINTKEKQLLEMSQKYIALLEEGKFGKNENAGIITSLNTKSLSFFYLGLILPIFMFKSEKC